MKIVIDARAIKQTGVGRYIEELVTQLLAQDHDNQYVLLVREEDRSKLKFATGKDLPANLELVSANYLWFTFAEQWRGWLLLHRLKPDLVHFPNFNHPILYRGRFVMTYHDLTLWEFKNIKPGGFTKKLVYLVRDLVMKLMVQHGLYRATYILTPSDYVRQSLSDKFYLPAHKIIRTYEAVDSSPLPKRIATNPKPSHNLAELGIDRPFILYVGAAYPHKNLERLILAFGRLVTDYMLDVQLVLVGKRDIFVRRLSADVAQVELKDKVIMTGYVDDATLAELYKAAEIYSFPSLSEGFGLPGLEAMNHGLPVASSNATCLPEIYGSAAVYYDPRDTDDMARVMADLIADKAKQDRLRQAGRAQITKYSWVKTAAETLVIYKRALRK